MLLGDVGGPTHARGDDEHLARRVSVPRRPGAGQEGDFPGAHVVHFRGEDRGNVGRAGEAIGAADLTGAIMAEADLRGADLTGAVLEGVDLSEAQTKELVVRSRNGTTKLKTRIDAARP